MQLKDTLTSVLAPLGWMGVDLLSFIQILFCFVLGCLVKRTWSWSHKRADKAFLKNKLLNDASTKGKADKLLGKEPASDSTPLESPMSGKKTRQANAQERKRARKTKEGGAKSPSEAQLVKPMPMEPVLKTPPTPEEPISEANQQSVQSRLLKQCEKKQEQEQRLFEKEISAAEETTEKCELHRAQAEVSAAVLPETAEPKHVSDNEEGQHLQKEHLLQTALQDEHEGSEDMEEERLLHDNASSIVAPALEQQSCENPDDIAGDGTACGSPNPLVPPLDLTEVVNKHDADPTPSTQSQAEADDCYENQICLDSAPTAELETESLPENTHGERQSFSEHEAQDEAEAHGLCEISTPELTPRNLDSPSMQWCNMNTLPPSEDQLCQEVQPEVHVDAWVPVAIPVEYLQTANEGTTIHPACFFNGFWQNSRDETIMIEGSELKFHNGPVWIMKEHNLNGFSVEVGGAEYHAELAVGGQQLLWSDGDIWTCIGRLQHDPSPLWIQDQSDLDKIMMAAEGYICTPSELGCVDNVPPMLVPPPEAVVENEQEEEEDWEECWEWKQRGWCRRGTECSWKHPPCRMWQADGPFAEDKAPSGRYMSTEDWSGPAVCEPCA